MNKPILGIIGGGQLGSLLSVAAKKLGIKTIILSDDPDAPAQHFADVFICGNYHDKKNINDFTKLVDIVTYEFENIPFEILDSIHKTKNIFWHSFIYVAKNVVNMLEGKALVVAIMMLTAAPLVVTDDGRAIVSDVTSNVTDVFTVEESAEAVSYTHLTLPTILLV